MKNYDVKKIFTPTVLPIKDNTVTAWSELLSNQFQAQLMLYNAVGMESTEGDMNTAVQGAKMNDLLKAAMGFLRDLGNSLSTAQQVRYVVETSNHWRNLVKQVQDEQADLMVTSMPASGEQTPGRLTALMYNSPCPVFFVREGMVPAMPKKILLPLRQKDGFEQQLPIVITWAKNFNATIYMSSFIPDGTSAKDTLRLLQRAERMEKIIRKAGLKLETETNHGFHFGTTMIQRAEQLGTDLIAVSVKPTNYLERMFNKMVGPFFLENSPVPVLSLPLSVAEAKLVNAAAIETPTATPNIKPMSMTASMEG